MNFWKSKSVLITGGAGFIGSHLARNLVDEGSTVTIVDNLERGTYEAIEDLAGKITFLDLDLSFEKECDTAFLDDYDVVIHMASKVGGIGYYTSKPYEVIQKMSKVDTNVLERVLAQDIPPLYFYASSAHVYPIELQGTPDSVAISEEQAYPANPELSYGWAKLLAEKQILYAAQENPDFCAAIGRYIGIFGPGQDYNLATGSVIPVFTHRALRYPEIPFSVWGTGQETRSYCYIDDAIECTKLMIEKMQEKSIVGPLNVGKQERVKIEDIAKNIIDISGKNIHIEYDTTKETKIWGQWCDCTKASDELDGWEAKVSFKEGLEKVYLDIKGRIK
jgi:nucleoside-diphosphate-sugar epimerase|tara:strand:- start:31350 stop:32351 length:1002 start_codon:yes stop_codon:yes gene_type:complete